MTKRIDFADWTFSGEVAQEIAKGLGWRPGRGDPQHYEDRSDTETGYYQFSSGGRDQFPKFDPLGDVELALTVARLIARDRRATLELECDPSGMWSASFHASTRRGGVPSQYREPAQALCEAMISILRTPDHRRLLHAEDLRSHPRAPGGVTGG